MTQAEIGFASFGAFLTRCLEIEQSDGIEYLFSCKPVSAVVSYPVQLHSPTGFFFNETIFN